MVLLFPVAIVAIFYGLRWHRATEAYRNQAAGRSAVTTRRIP